MSSHLTQGGRSIYGRGKRTADYTGISADEIINNPEEALKKHSGISQGAIDNTNQKIIEFNKINNSIGAAFKNDLLRKLSDEIETDIAGIRSITDWKSAKVKWQRDIVQRATDPVSGKVSPEISAFISNASRAIDRTGITVGISEASKKSLDVFTDTFNGVALALNDGDLDKANKKFRQSMGMLNEYEALGSIDKGLVTSIRRTAQRKYNDRSMGVIQNSTFTHLNTSGYDVANKYLNKVKGMINLSKASLPKQRAYSKFLSLFKRMPNQSVVKLYDQSITNFVKYGVGNVKHLVQGADPNIARLEGMKKLGSNNEGIISAQNDIRAFKKVGTALGDIYNKGGASVFSPILLEGINSTNINGIITKLNISDPDEVDAAARIITTISSRINREAGGDPVEKALIIDNMFKQSVGTVAVDKPKNIFETIAREKEISQKYYGSEAFTDKTIKFIVDAITKGDPSPEGVAYKQKLLDAVGENPQIQSQLLKAKNGDFNTDLQSIAAKHGSTFPSLFPTASNARILQSLYKKEGFRSVLGNLRKVAFSNDKLNSAANAMGLSRGNLAHMVGFELAARSTRNIPDEISFAELNYNIADKGLSTRIESVIDKKLSAIMGKFYISNNGNFSIQKNSSLGESLVDFEDNVEGVGYNIAKFVNKESFHAGKTIKDLFSDEEFIADNTTKDNRLKFYNGLSAITGIPAEAFHNRVTLKQHDVGKDYFLVFPTEFNDGYHNVTSKQVGISRNKFKISEDSMRKALSLPNKDAVISYLLGGFVNDTER